MSVGGSGGDVKALDGNGAEEKPKMEPPKSKIHNMCQNVSKLIFQGLPTVMPAKKIVRPS